jgi:hypothetical protein
MTIAPELLADKRTRQMMRPTPTGTDAACGLTRIRCRLGNGAANADVRRRPLTDFFLLRPPFSLILIA